MEKQAYIQTYHMETLLEERHLRLLTMKRYARKDILMRANTPLTQVMFLVEGRAKTSYLNANGHTILHSFLYPLAILGEVELWQQEPLLNEVEALSDVVCLNLPIRCASTLKQDVRFLRYIAEELSEKLKNSNRNASISLAYPVENRLASYILAVCSNDLFCEDHGSVAEMIGCSYRQLQRCLLSFCTQGYLHKVAKSCYRIQNIIALQALGEDVYGGMTAKGEKTNK